MLPKARHSIWDLEVRRRADGAPGTGPVIAAVIVITASAPSSPIDGGSTEGVGALGFWVRTLNLLVRIGERAAGKCHGKHRSREQTLVKAHKGTSGLRR